MNELNALWIPIVGILMPLVLVPTIMILKHRMLQKEWQHKERMKGIENGVPASLANGGGGVAAVGAGVPIASVAGAVVTSLFYQAPEGDEVAVLGIVWGCALMIGAFGMISSLVLARIHSRARAETDSLYTARSGKPAFDPDAFDVVSSRA
jgi:hypothetical protein